MKIGWVYRFVLVACVVSGCSRFPMQRTAQFRERPDSVRKGDLRGPYSGKIIAQNTGEAVAGALIYATWSFQSGAGLAQRSGYKQFVGTSDKQGRYQIPPIGKLPASKQLPAPSIPNGARLVDFRLLVYKRGYVAYRSDHRFSDLSKRFDFAQKANVVTLKPWAAEDSHTRHVRFVGSGPALAKFTHWELTEAAAELAEAKPSSEPAPASAPTGPALLASQLLSAAEIRTITGYQGEFTAGPLANRPNTDTYSSHHFRAKPRSTDNQSLDVAVRVWNLGPDKSESHYDTTVQKVPGVTITDTDGIATKSFRAADAGVLGVGFWDRDRHVFVLVTCGEKQCKTQDTVAALAKLIYQKMTQLDPKVPNNGKHPTNTPKP